MDWAVAAVLIVAIAAWLADRVHERRAPEKANTEAIGFHVGELNGSQEDEGRRR